MHLRQNFLLVIPFLFSNCLFYSLSGSSVNRECKTFSLGEVAIDTVDSPHNVADTLKSILRSKLKGETGLNEVDSDGDIHFDFVITDYKTEVIPGNDKVKLSMGMNVTYKNKYDQERQFTEKKFNHSIDVPISEVGNNAKNDEKLLNAILDEVFNQSINAWD